MGFDPGSARLVERVKRNFDEKRLTGEAIIDVAKAFYSVWIEDLLFKITVLEFPSYLVKIITPLPTLSHFVAAFQAATSSCLLMRAGVA